MPKRRPPRRKRDPVSTIVAPLALLAVAAIVAWALFRPTHHRPYRHVPQPLAVTTATPAQETPQPVETTAPPSESPSGIPTAVESATLPPAPPKIANPNGPKLALIIDDCGQWIDTERGFVALPVPLTMSVLPDVHYGSTIAREASDAGKGVMLHLPMETLSGMNPGPGKVTTEMTDAEITSQVESDLAQVPLAAGVNNHEGSRASADPRVMRDVIAVISKRGNLFFIDSRTNGASVAERAASDAGVPTAGRDVFLDNTANVAYSEDQLRHAAEIAKKTGSAIAIGHPRPTTLAAVRALIPELQAEGIDFVLAQSLTH